MVPPAAPVTAPAKEPEETVAPTIPPVEAAVPIVVPVATGTAASSDEELNIEEAVRTSIALTHPSLVQAPAPPVLAASLVAPAFHHRLTVHAPAVLSSTQDLHENMPDSLVKRQSR